MRAFKKLIMMANQSGDKPSLPPHMKRCEYLESTGEQYLDIGSIGSNNKIVICADIPKSTANRFLLGNSSDSENIVSFNLTTNNSNNYFGTAKYTGSLARDGYSVYSISREGIEINGTLYKWSTAVSDFLAKNVKLFSSVSSTGTISASPSGKLYSCLIYEHDILIHNYIPCFNLKTYRPCMYDTITGIVLYNQGRGEFGYNYNVESKDAPYLCFEALEDDFQASFSGENCEYSLDREVWVMLTKSEYTPKINAGSKIYFKNSSPVQSSSTSGVGIFSATKLFNIYGRATSMLYGDDFVNIQSVDKAYMLASMFAGNKCVCSVDAEFFNIGISNASRTFDNCFTRSSVIKAEIPYIESPQGYTFTGVFSSSTLTEITISDDYLAYNSDFQSAFLGCNISRLVIPKIKSGIYTCNAIAKNCKNLNTVIIKGGACSTGCFYNAFEGCSSLTKIISLYTVKFLYKNGCSNWLNGVSEQGVIIFNKNIEWNPKDIINGNTDDNGEIITWGIPAGWTVKYCDPDNINDVRDEKW